MKPAQAEAGQDADINLRGHEGSPAEGPTLFHATHQERQGSGQEDLWGANSYPGRGEEGCIEYTSLINIRPSQGNRSMLVEDEGVRARIREITFELVGRGEPLE